MKRSIHLLLCTCLLVLPSVALAGVAGTPHDMQGHATAAGELCFSCHVPHNAGGEKLWARAATGPFTGVQNLCHSCHGGGVTTVGSDTVMDDALEQHLTVGADCSGDGACHDVHDNQYGDFLSVSTAGLDNPCEACHNATPAIANSWGDHTAVASGNHRMSAGSFECNQCHTVHGAVAQTNPIGTLTAPILLADNSTTYYGDFCISCHNGTAPTGGTVGAGGVAAGDVFNYAEAAYDGTELKHPTINTAGWGGTGVGGCNKCHDVHNPGSTTTHLLLSSNEDSAYCVSCHDGSTAPGTTGGGGGSHFTGIPASVTMNTLTAGPTLPWADNIDDDGEVGADYAGTANNMVCETCHSAHRAGQDGYFLRNANGATNAICSRCHVDN